MLAIEYKPEDQSKYKVKKGMVPYSYDVRFCAFIISSVLMAINSRTRNTASTQTSTETSCQFQQTMAETQRSSCKTVEPRKTATTKQQRSKQSSNTVKKNTSATCFAEKLDKIIDEVFLYRP